MKFLFGAVAAFLVSTLSGSPAMAQTSFSMAAPANDQNPAPVKMQCWNGSVYAACPGGATSVADGADVTEGAKADAAYAGSGSASVVSILKGLYTGLVAPTPAGSFVIGKVGIDQTTPGTTNGVAAAGIGASGATRAGNPLAIAGAFNTTQPTVTTGQAVDLQTNNRGALQVVLSSGGTLLAYTGSADATAGVNGLDTTSYNKLWNSASWDRARSIGGATSAGTGVMAVAVAPTSLAGAGLTTASSGSATSAVLKASASNLYSLNAANGATAGFAVVYDATVAPADGALTASLVRYCVYLNANDVLRDPIGTPIALTNGGVFFVSSTSCTTKTAVTYNFVSAQVP